MVKEFEGNPFVVTAVLSQQDTETAIETFWRNFYLRGPALYDPTGVIGGTLYQQPYGGVPFSRAWVITPDQTVALAEFGHHPEKVIGVIRDLLVPLECDGPVSANCLHLDWVGDEPWLRLARGSCGPAGPSTPFDVIRGRLGYVRPDNGAIDLGAVECVADDVALDRVLDLSADPAVTCSLVPAVFYLARASADDAWGAASGGEPRSITEPDQPCP